MSYRTVRKFFTFRWRPMRTPKRANPFSVTARKFMGMLRWARRHWKLLIILIFVLPVSLGIVLRLFGGTGFSIYDDYNVKEIKTGYSGGIWDFLWGLRGQPPGYGKPTGTFSVAKVDTSGKGLNGPLNPLFLVTGLEFIFVDCLIYAPAFLFGNINILTNLDIFLGFFLFPFGKFFLDAMFLAPLVIIGAIIGVLAPLFLGFYTVPMIMFIGENIPNLFKIGVLVTILFGFLFLTVILFRPENLDKLFGVIWYA